MSFGQLCNQRGCRAYADWQVGFVMYADPALFPKAPPVPAWLGLYLCDAHKKETRVEDIVTDEGWTQICEGFKKARRVLPKRKLTQLQFRPVPAELMFPRGM